MIFVIILIVFNLFIIVMLSNIKPPSIHNLFKHKLTPVMRLQNKGIPLNEIEIKKYHSLHQNIIKEIKESENNE